MRDKCCSSSRRVARRVRIGMSIWSYWVISSKTPAVRKKSYSWILLSKTTASVKTGPKSPFLNQKYLYPWPFHIHSSSHPSLCPNSTKISSLSSTLPNQRTSLKLLGSTEAKEVWYSRLTCRSTRTWSYRWPPPKRTTARKTSQCHRWIRASTWAAVSSSWRRKT